MFLKDLFEQFVRDKTYNRNVTAATVKFYRSSWAITEKYLKAKTVEELSKDILRDLIVDWREKAKQQPKSVNTYISCLNSFFTWLMEEGYTESHHKIKKLRVEQTIFRVFTEAHIKVILRYQPKGYFENRMWTMLCLILDSGLRISEVLEIQESDIRFEQSLIVVQGKGRKERYVPVSKEMRRHLFRFIKYKKQVGIDNKWLFPTATNRPVGQRNFLRDMKRFCERLGITDVRVSPHSLRHSYAVWYLMNGGDLYTLSRTLGHSSISVTQIYLRSMGIEQVTEAHENFSPLSKR